MDFVRPIEAIVPGVQGRVLAVLAQTTAALNLSTIARLAGVSQAQASRVLPPLVELGVVERTEVPPSSLFRLVPEHVVSRLVLGLGRAGDAVLDDLGQLAGSVPVPPVSLIAFGSFARGEAVADSDIDVVVVRPDGVDEDDDDWAASVEQWRAGARRLTGNHVDVLEVTRGEAMTRLAGASELWDSIRQDGRVLYGLGLDDLRSPSRA